MRSLFDELMQGLEELRNEREGDDYLSHIQEDEVTMIAQSCMHTINRLWDKCNNYTL